MFVEDLNDRESVLKSSVEDEVVVVRWKRRWEGGGGCLYVG